MEILTKVPDAVSQSRPIEQFQSCLYDLPATVATEVSNKLLPGSTVILFSGGHRLSYNATYIEAKMFSHCDLEWKPNTLFVDPANSKLLMYTIQKIAPANLLILNTSIFIGYRHWQEISKDINNFKTVSQQVIATLPIERFDFNRLKYSAQDITNLLQGMLIDNTVVVCR